MQRRYFPSILLYGFGLALALSLVFNGFLLYKQSHQRNIYESELGYAVRPVDRPDWQQQLSDCEKANQEKDSVIVQLKQAPIAPPGQTVIVQRTAAK